MMDTDVLEKWIVDLGVGVLKEIKHERWAGTSHESLTVWAGKRHYTLTLGLAIRFRDRVVEAEMEQRTDSDMKCSWKAVTSPKGHAVKLALREVVEVEGNSETWSI